jgi:hypothetical protein
LRRDHVPVFLAGITFKGGWNVPVTAVSYAAIDRWCRPVVQL